MVGCFKHSYNLFCFDLHTCTKIISAGFPPNIHSGCVLQLLPQRARDWVPSSAPGSGLAETCLGWYVLTSNLSFQRLSVLML